MHACMHAMYVCMFSFKALKATLSWPDDDHKDQCDHDPHMIHQIMIHTELNHDPSNHDPHRNNDPSNDKVGIQTPQAAHAAHDVTPNTAALKPREPEFRQQHIFINHPHCILLCQDKKDNKLTFSNFPLSIATKHTLNKANPITKR